MAKKVILKDQENIEIMPITRGELIVDSLGNPAFSSSQFLATDSQPGLMSAEDKTKLDNLEKVTVTDNKVEQVNTTTSDSYRLLFSSTADDTTRTEGARKSAKLLFNPSTGALTASIFNGKLDWSNINNKPDVFTPEQHTHTTQEIISLAGYTKAKTAAALSTSDSLNTALGKLELKADTAYTLVKGAYDGDGTIENLTEILKVLSDISDTDTIQALLDKYLPLSGGTLTNSNIPLSINRTNGNPIISYLANDTLVGLLGFNTDGVLITCPNCTTNTNCYNVLHTGNSHIKDGVITINGVSITPLTAHQSLANYVTLNTAQTISGAKTLTATLIARDINPQTNNTYTLGTSSLQWKNIYSGLGTFSRNVTALGFAKTASSDSYVLLGGGGHKLVSDFMLKTEELSNNLTTITKSLNVTQAWMDTGITSTNLPASGTYIVQVHVNTNDSIGDMYNCYSSGVMSWYTYGTNDTETDEIILHRSGHAYGKTIYLRTVMQNKGILKLQIGASSDIGKASTYTFKFKRII